MENFDILKMNNAYEECCHGSVQGRNLNSSEGSEKCLRGRVDGAELEKEDMELSVPR